MSSLSQLKTEIPRLENGDRLILEPDQEGVINSLMFPGLWLDVRSLLDGNLTQVLEILQQGIESAEHQEFIHRLC